MALPMLLMIFLFPLALLLAGPAVSMVTKSRRWSAAITILALAIIAVSSIYVMASGTYLSTGGYITIYPFACFFLLLFSIIMGLVTLLAYNRSKYYLEFSFLAALSLSGAFFVATSASLLTLFVGLEMISLSTTLMIMFEGKHRVESAVKFFVVSSISIALIGFALTLLFPSNPGLALTAQTLQSNNYMVYLALGLFVAALGFEGAIFPFNLWIPDVYQGAPTFVTALMSGFNKKVAFLALIEVLFIIFYAYSGVFSPVLKVLAVLTMFFGNLLAISADNVKRMFAYSSISQAGYILIGMSAATSAGLSASLFYIFAHALMIVGAFAIVLLLEAQNIKSIEDYTALSSRNWMIAASLSIIMLSMAGIPPLIGFAGKFLLFSSAFSAGLPLLAVLGVVNSFISIYYYSKVINAMFMRKKAAAVFMDLNTAIVVGFVLLMIILIGVYPQPLIHIAQRAAASIGLG